MSFYSNLSAATDPSFPNSIRKKKKSVGIVTCIKIFYITNSGFLSLSACDLQHYIVYMGEHFHPNLESVVRANHEILASVTG